MCGIAGIWNRDGQVLAPTSLGAMVECLRHRGPDGHGTWMQGSIGFAHTRLSIIDLSDTGSQPFVSSDGRYVLVFNGEIYNYKELTDKYFAKNSFISHSDTEVLLNLLMTYGQDALPLLRGMFAFAFFDTAVQELLLACDPFGKKPLYYAWANDTFVFASEPKALFASGYIEPQVSLSAIPDYLQHEYVSLPVTCYTNVLILPGGHSMTVAKSNVSIATWWRPLTQPKKHISFSTAAKIFDNLLGQAVERRMVSDVPVGIFLSGGLDSSTIAWYMRRAKPQAEIHSCSVVFEDDSFNEDHYASAVAELLHTTHHTLTFTENMMKGLLTELMPLVDIPFADASLLPTYVVSKLAGTYIKVVLGGDGADELLGGYGTFDAYEIAQRLSWVPRIVWRGLEYAVQDIIPVSHHYFSFDFKLKSFLRGAQFPSPANLAVWLGAFTYQELNGLIRQNISSPYTSIVSIDTHIEPFDRASLLHVSGYLANDILVKFDRATMAASLEARTPFLDVDLAEFVLQLPAEYKRHKRILRHVMRSRLPDAIMSRKKQGFGIPIGSWLMTKDSIAREVLSRTRIDSAGIFHYGPIDHLLTSHESGKRDFRKKIWTLIMFQLWYEYWILGKRDVSISPLPN